MHLLDNGSGDYAPVYGYDSAREFIEAGEGYEFRYMGFTLRTWAEDDYRFFKWPEFDRGFKADCVAFAKWCIDLEGSYGLSPIEWIGGGLDWSDHHSFADATPKAERDNIILAAIEDCEKSGYWKDVERRK